MRQTILIASLLLVSCSNLNTQHVNDQITMPENEPDSEVRPKPLYIEQFSGRGMNENGKEFSFHTYTGPEGEKVTTRFESYEQSGAVRKRYNQIAKSSLKIVEEVPLRDQNDLQIGERVLLKIRKDSDKAAWESVLAVGTKLYIIRSDSIETMRAFESEFIPSVLAIR